MYVAHLCPYKYYVLVAKVLIWIATPILFYTLLFAGEINDAGRWLMLPIINIRFQPSDLAKLSLVMYIASTMAQNKEHIRERKIFLKVMGWTIVICGLIFPSNFSTAVLLFVTAIVLMFIGGIRFKYLFGTVGIIASLLIVFFFVARALPAEKRNSMGRVGTWVARIERFTGSNQETAVLTGSSVRDFQADQAKIAIASSGLLWGKGPGGSSQRNILPHPYSDFIFAIIIEEYGMVFSWIIILLYLTLLFRTIKIARKCNGTFGNLVAFGIVFMIVVQAFVNMAVVVGLFPVTGQVLPFISLGGTSVLLTSLGIGIVLSVSVAVEQNELYAQDDNSVPNTPLSNATPPIVPVTNTAS
ncbi:hypothetical protein FACS1894201_10350 [Bacteroidia bacterium]|nr:hypothetical protein FACS1894201_10350 [Bacteroidia bacterium]